VNDRTTEAQLLPTPFFSSFVGQARPGERFVGNIEVRAATWASWVLDNIVQMTGRESRVYPALVLSDSRFYDPKGLGPKGLGPSGTPHLEIPKKILDHTYVEFPYHLGLIGNGLAFEWWVMSEIKAVRRALFTTSRGSLKEAVEVLGQSQEPLAAALERLMSVAAPQWSVVEGLLVTLEDGLSAEATGDFSKEEVARYFPAGAHMQLRVSYDAALSLDQGRWAARRVGVWHVSGEHQGEVFSFGVITPRLTASSLFRDPLFTPEHESPAASLVRGLVLERLVRTRLNDEISIGVARAKDVEKGGGPRLRAIVSQPGQKTPEASMESAVHFIQQHETSASAWEALSSLARHLGALLTVTPEGFAAAYVNAQRYLRRAEDPSRDDVNVILPIGVDDKKRVVRFTYSRPAANEE
jgi:hypothetical protein